VTLAEMFDEAVASVGSVDRRDVNGGVEYLVDEQPFAALTGDTAEFRLDRLVGRAALGTPDAMPSPRGPEWIAFRPAALDRFASDRATAWFLSALRHARG
jgi:hypothetical protein